MHGGSGPKEPKAKEALVKETLGRETLLCLISVVEHTESLVGKIEKKLQNICKAHDKEVSSDKKNAEEIPEYFSNIRMQSDRINEINNRLESLLRRIEL